MNIIDQMKMMKKEGKVRRHKKKPGEYLPAFFHYLFKL